MNKRLDNVLRALQSLGQGLVLARPDLAPKLQAGEIETGEAFRPILRLLYGLLFSLARGGSEIATDGSQSDGAKWLEAAKKTLAGVAEESGPEIEALEPAPLAAAIRDLAFDENGQPVDWKDLEAQSLGSIHESILALQPVFSSENFELQKIRIGERRFYGSYYTPGPLIELLLDSSLEPAIERALGAKDPQAALLGLKICDPACGSGGILLAAAKRLARRLASLRTTASEGEALRDVLANCIYGVDINPESVLVCKMGLQLESPGSRGFHIVCGNFLLGASRRHILASPPGKNRAQAEKFGALARQIMAGGKGQEAWQRLIGLFDLWTMAFLRPREDLAGKFVEANGKPDPEFAARLAAQAEKFRFFHLETAFPEAADGFDVVLSNPPWGHNEIREREWFAAHDRKDIGRLAGNCRKKAIAGQRATPIFASYMVARQTCSAARNFYAQSGKYPLCGKGRHNLYALFAEAMLASLNSEGRLGCILPSGIATDNTTRHFFSALVESGRLASLFDFENRHRIFPDIDSRIKFCLLSAGPPDTSRSAQYAFFLRSPQDLEEDGRRFGLEAAELALLNPNTRTCPVFRNKKDAILARAVYRRLPILLKNTAEGFDNPWKIGFCQGMFNMTADSRLFRTREELTGSGYELEGNVFARQDEKFLPLFEARMIHHFNHRWATYAGRQLPRECAREELGNPDFVVLPRYWVAEAEVEKRFPARPWLLGFRNICRATDERTMVGGVFPWCAVGNSLTIWQSGAREAPFLAAMLTSFVCDFFARCKIGGTNFNFYLARQIAVLPPAVFRRPPPWDAAASLASWLGPRLLELVYTARDMRPFAEALGYFGQPFTWNEERRFLLRAELDAAFFQLYLPADKNGAWRECPNESAAQYRELRENFPTPRDAVAYIMEAFPIRRKKDLQKYGLWRTKEHILKIYDMMQKGL